LLVNVQNVERNGIRFRGREDEATAKYPAPHVSEYVAAVVVATENVGVRVVNTGREEKGHTISRKRGINTIG